MLERWKIKRKLRQAARLFDVDPKVLMVMAAVESGFNPLATNPSGAKGLFQYLPATAKEEGLADPFDVAEVAAVTAERVRHYTRFLQDNGIPTDPYLIYLCHQQGFAGVRDIWRVAWGSADLSAARVRNMVANCFGPVAKVVADEKLGGMVRAKAFLEFWRVRIEKITP